MSPNRCSVLYCYCNSQYYIKSSTMRKNDLRVWGVWDSLISRLEYLSESQNDCRHIIKLFEKSNRRGLELVRFDLCPLYYDSSISSFPVPSTRWSREGGIKSVTQKSTIKMKG